MTPRWAASSAKHGISRSDQIYAMLNATFRAEFDEEDLDEEGAVWLYIGHPHPQTDREIEVLVKVYADGRATLVFHAMELGPKFRRIREESRDGN